MAGQSLKQIQKEVAGLNDKMNDLIEIVQHLEEDVHDEKFEVRHGYVKKLERLEKGRFLTQEEFEKALREQ